MVNAVDQTARDAATKAQYMIEAHENECALRYAAVEKSFQAVEKSFKAGSERMAELKTGQDNISAAVKRGQDRIFTLLVAGGVATISTLFGATWWLAVAFANAIAKANGIVMP